MGFINNTSYILNAVLTKKGKEYLSKSDSKFNITKFALADDEIDYTLWDTAHPKGTNYYGAVLESTPMIEACVDPEVIMKYKLFTMPVGTKALPYISNVTPPALTGTSALVTEYNGDDVNFNIGAVYNEETGRLSKKVVSKTVTLRTQQITFNRETSIIITGQMSGAIYVLPVLVNYVDNTPGT